MASIAESLMIEVLSRVKTATVIAETGNIRRDHRTVIPIENAPAVHLIDGAETPAPSKNDCYVNADLTFTLAIFVRNDSGYAAADPIKIAIMAALNPAIAYPSSAILSRQKITSEQQVADSDALRVDMEFTFKYQQLAWAL